MPGFRPPSSGLVVRPTLGERAPNQNKRTESVKPAKLQKIESVSEGAKAHPKYHDRHEEYVLVTRDDLREIRALGWTQQALFGAGTFFFSGAFWLFAELVAHEEQEGKYEFTAWMGMCLVSMAAGALLGGAGLFFYSLRQKRLDKYFKEETTAETSQS
jgi:hypothetical protein